MKLRVCTWPAVFLVACLTFTLPTNTVGEDGTVAFRGSRKQQSRCPANDADKINCGFAGIEEQQCKGSGCCYAKPQSVGTPWCFFPSNFPTLAPETTGRCTIPNDDRLDCGQAGITSDECHKKGCCYYHATTPNVPFCYYKLHDAPKEVVKKKEQCSILDTERVECGWQGISRTQCRQKGCCYQHSLTPGAAFCYYTMEDAPKDKVAEVQQCTVSDSEKVDCGFHGITPDGCRRQGCCYMHSRTPGTPFCFFKKGSWSGSAPTHKTQAATRVLLSMCSAASLNRVDCGFSGITESTCRDRGCCYAHSSVRGAPFCFYRSAAVPTTTQSHSQTATAATAAPATSYKVVTTSLSASMAVNTQNNTALSGLLEWGSDYAQNNTAAKGLLKWGSDNAQAVLGSTRTGSSANAKRLMAALTGPAIFLLTVAYFGCCRPTQKSCPTPEEDQLLDSAVLEETGCTECTKLLPDSDAYQEFHRLFVQKWDTTRWPSVAGRDVPPPPILEIFELSSHGQATCYKAKQRAIDMLPGPKEGTRPGNAKRRFHGARMTCDFQGTPCRDPRCTVCRVVEQGSFSTESVAGCGIRFSAGTHTAKGQGLAPGKEPPPTNLEHFVSFTAGNAVFVADVLLGRPQTVASQTDALPPAGVHSRVADQACGVDEIVIFDEAQALPRALILFP